MKTEGMKYVYGIVRIAALCIAGTFVLTGCSTNNSTSTASVEEAKEKSILDGYIMQTEIDQESGQVYRYIEVPGTVIKNLDGDTIKQYCEINGSIIDVIKTPSTELPVDPIDFSTPVTSPVQEQPEVPEPDNPQPEPRETEPTEPDLDSYIIKEVEIKNTREEISESSGDDGNSEKEPGNAGNEKAAVETSSEGETGQEEKPGDAVEKRAYIEMTVEDYHKLSREAIDQFLKKNSKEYDYFTILLSDGRGMCIYRDQEEYNIGPVNEDGVVISVDRTYNVETHAVKNTQDTIKHSMTTAAESLEYETNGDGGVPVDPLMQPDIVENETSEDEPVPEIDWSLLDQTSSGKEGSNGETGNMQDADAGDSEDPQNTAPTADAVEIPVQEDESD